MEKNILLSGTDIKKSLLETIGRQNPALTPLTVTRPWISDQGFSYDRIEYLDDEVFKGFYLTDSANGTNNPTACPLENLTASDLLYLLQDFVIKEGEALTQDYDGFTGKPEIADWAADAVQHLSEAATAFSISAREAACRFIFDCLTILIGKEKGNGRAVKVNFNFEDIEYLPLPYTIELDTFQGLVPENTGAINDLTVKGTGTLPYGLKGKENRYIDAYCDDETCIRILETDIHTLWPVHREIPDEAIFNLERWMNAILLREETPGKGKETPSRDFEYEVDNDGRAVLTADTAEGMDAGRAFAERLANALAPEFVIHKVSVCKGTAVLNYSTREAADHQPSDRETLEIAYRNYFNKDGKTGYYSSTFSGPELREYKDGTLDDFFGKDRPEKKDPEWEFHHILSAFGFHPEEMEIQKTFWEEPWKN